MKNTRILLALALLLTAAPLWGGTIYIPLAVHGEIDGNAFNTEVRFHNDDDARTTGAYLFLPEEVNGADADRENGFTEFEIAGHATVTLDDLVPAGARGILELRVDDAVAVNARLVGTDPDNPFTGVEVPVVTSLNAVLPGETAVLAGLQRKPDEVVTDFYLVNLSISYATCAVEAFRRGGTKIDETTLSVEPLTLLPFADALDLLGISATTDAAIAVTCDQPVHAYATVHELATAHMLYLKPAGKGSADLDPFPLRVCPDDALIHKDGAFHTPQAGDERATFLVDSPKGNFSELRLTMEFTPGDWNRNSSGLHAIFWLNRTRVWRGNVFGYLNVFGPNANRLKNAVNIGLPAGEMDAEYAGAVLEKGRTYTVDYIYSTASRLAEAVVSIKGGPEVGRIKMTPKPKKIVSTGEWMLVFGHETGEAGEEVPSYGWRYANLCLTME